MPNLTGLDLATLRTMTGAQIKAAIVLPTTKQTLIEWLLDSTEFMRSSEMKQRTDKQADLQTVIYQDALGAKTRTVKTQWTYFPDGVVKKIVVKTFDANNVLLSKQVSRHRFSGDTQPISVDDEA